jgi:hypothetical protein
MINLILNQGNRPLNYIHNDSVKKKINEYIMMDGWSIYTWGGFQKQMHFSLRIFTKLARGKY